jgi:hypothetical protein
MEKPVVADIKGRVPVPVEVFLPGLKGVRCLFREDCPKGVLPIFLE